MAFKKGDRVEHVNCDHKATVDYDDGEYVRVEWDDGKVGLLKYERGVMFDAYRLNRLAPSRS